MHPPHILLFELLLFFNPPLPEVDMFTLVVVPFYDAKFPSLPCASLLLQSPSGAPVIRRNVCCPLRLWLNSTTLTMSSLILLLQLDFFSLPLQLE